ncbi:MAG: hypothetical protein CME97_10310 [Hyphomonas sp.]|nr:hypothetical protein [Hyphomonas sp.]HBL91989.1 hypothetical protein [Hyphomonas sp.]
MSVFLEYLQGTWAGDPLFARRGPDTKRAVRVHLAVNLDMRLGEAECGATKSDENTFFAPCFCKPVALKCRSIGQRIEETAQC